MPVLGKSAQGRVPARGAVIHQLRPRTHLRDDARAGCIQCTVDRRGEVPARRSGIGAPGSCEHRAPRWHSRRLMPDGSREPPMTSGSNRFSSSRRQQPDSPARAARGRSGHWTLSVPTPATIRRDDRARGLFPVVTPASVEELCGPAGLGQVRDHGVPVGARYPLHRIAARVLAAADDRRHNNSRRASAR